MNSIIEKPHTSRLNGPGRVSEILEWLDCPAVLLPIPHGKKSPSFDGWQNISSIEMQKPEYVARFANGSNVGVLLGAPSSGLCSIDLDDDGLVENFLEANPRLRATLQTKRLRGCNFWVRITGDYPSIKPFHHARLKNEKQKPLAVGEWRSTGGQTVIHGQVDGLPYQRVVEAKPIEMRFDEIIWPEWILDPPALAEPKPEKSQGGRLDLARLEQVATLPNGDTKARCPACAEMGEDATGDHLLIKADGRFGCAKYQDDHEHRRAIWRLAGTGAKSEIIASKEDTEFEFANALEAVLPPVKTVGSSWYSYHRGTWHPTDRASFRPQAQAILPEAIRTARRESTLLDHLEGRCQVRESDFAGFYKFGPDGEILINCSNGLLEINPKGAIRMLEHDRAHLFTLQVAAQYDPQADCPIFHRVLDELLLDADDRNLLQLFAGYMLLPDCRYEAALVAYGEAGRGKSTVAEAIAAALGSNLVSRCTLSQICDPKSYHVPKLKYAAVNLGTELDAVQLDDSGNFKALVSGESIEARPIYGRPFTMNKPSCKLMFLANSLPRFKHGTDAELRRTRFIRFDVLPVQKDTLLKTKLVAEANGVFKWMVNGLVDLLVLPEIPVGGRPSRETLDRFRISNDPVGAFVTLRCQLDRRSNVPKDDLRHAYDEFCERHELPASCGDWFLKSLYERWPQLKDARLTADNGDRYRAITGISLRK